MPERVRILHAGSVFAELPSGTLTALAEGLEQAHYDPGAPVFREHERGDRAYIVAAGQGELSAEDRGQNAPLAILVPGEVVGERALLDDDSERNATLTALTDLTVFVLHRRVYQSLVVDYPEIGRVLADHSETLLTASFIGRVGPCMTLGDAARRRLAKQVVRRRVAAGATIIRAGEAGHACYMVRSGRVDVLGAGDRLVTSLERGAVFGEAALLTNAARTATVRAAVDCELLELDRTTVDAMLADEPEFGRAMVRLFRLRQQPRRASGVLLFERQTEAGENVTILKNPDKHTYFRLSDRGRFVWEQLNGERDLRDLTLAVLDRFGEFAPDAVGRVLVGLRSTGMLDGAKLSAEVRAVVAKPALSTRALIAARRFTSVQLSARNLDPYLAAGYSRGVRVLYTLPAQLFLAAVAIAGLVALVLGVGRVHGTLDDRHGAVLALVPAALVASMLLHEAAHAFTVKAFGREVHRGGVGLYFFMPVAFIDTSDMWLATRRQRILVSLAGPYANALIGGVASLVALLASSDTVIAVAWTLALANYLVILANANPLLEFDGYHVLSDLLDRPSLRPQAMAWLGTSFPRVLRDRIALKEHRVDLAYSLAALAYLVVLAAAVVIVYRLALRGYVEYLLPTSVAGALTWMLAVSVVALVALRAVADLRGARQRTAR